MAAAGKTKNILPWFFKAKYSTKCIHLAKKSLQRPCGGTTDSLCLHSCWGDGGGSLADSLECRQRSARSSLNEGNRQTYRLSGDHERSGPGPTRSHARRSRSGRAPDAPVKMQVLAQQVREGLSVCISSRLPGRAKAAGPRTAPGTPELPCAAAARTHDVLGR